MDAIEELSRLGQSIWYDNVSRALLDSGEMKALFDGGITGVTSNPTIFEKAINGTPAYDAQLHELIDAREDPDAALEALVSRDIRTVADLLRGVYDRTKGLDGYVSIEEAPDVAYDTAGSIADASRLRDLVDRPNVMIKIPSTLEGIAAVEEAIFAGINVNITLMFSLKAYEDTALAFIRGIERRLDAGLRVNSIASVASFFVSRVDTLVDKLLDEKIAASSGAEDAERLRSLQGKAAIANAKIAYQKFLELFHGERFARCRAAGAQVQRVLWASTSTKNPAYRDVMYVEGLIGPETINTLPPATVAAVREHAVIRPSLMEGVDEARQVLADLADAGIDMDAVTLQLQQDGVESFAASWRALQESVRGKLAVMA